MLSLQETLTQALWHDLRPPVDGARILSPSAERPSWVQIMDRATPAPWRNAIFHSELSPQEVRATIERVISEYSNAGLPISWYVTPMTRPRDMWRYLQHYGFTQSEVLEGMAIGVDELQVETSPPFASADSLEVEEVTLASLDIWLDLFQRGWMVEAEIAHGVGDALRLAMETGVNGSRRFFARFNGIPAGIASLKPLPGAAHLYSTVVLPEFRKKGVYRTLLAHRRDEAQRSQCKMLTVHCVPDSSAPICRKLGFRDICRIEVWKRSP